MTNTAIRSTMPNLSKPSCDYEGGLSKVRQSVKIVVKNTVWTEFALAAAG
jgi:hypothetical protein